MGYPLLFGPPSLNAPSVHQYDVPITIGGTATAVSWFLYGVTLTRPTSTTLKVQFPDLYKYLCGFEQGRQPVLVSSQVGWIVTTNNLAVDGSVTLTAVSAGSATAPANGDKFTLTFRVSSDAQIDAYTGSVA